MEKKYWMIASVVLVVILFGFVAAKTNGTQGTDTSARGTVEYVGEAQEVTLKGGRLEGGSYGYVVEPNTLKKDVPVRMEVDLTTVSGCMRSVTIPAFGIQKRVSDSDNVIEFTPDKTGTFTIACSMNMIRGEFTVV